MDRRRGFTLIEIMVVMMIVSLMAGAMAPLAAGQIQGQRIRTTHDRMQRVIAGMVGDPSREGHGYLGDVGMLPPSVEDLNQSAGLPAYAIDPNDGIGVGYNGPYVPQAASGVIAIDAWGTPFAYASAAAQLTSAGADRRMGTEDDLVYPEEVPITLGNVSISVVGVPNDGGPPCLLVEDDASVLVGVSRAGERREVSLTGPAGAGGPFTASGLHKGFHGLRVEGRNAFEGVQVRDVLELRGGNAQHRVTLVQLAGPPPACGA